MPLAGNLRQFALPDVLRVIESGQRTGRLLLSRGKMRAAIYFSGGQWLWAERQGAAVVLAQQLARVGLIHPEQFERAVGIPFAEAGSVSDVQVVRNLLASRLLTQEELRGFAIKDAVALLAVVLAWPDGDFAFEDGAQTPQGRVAIPLPVAPLVSEAMRTVRGTGGPARDIAPLAPEAVVDFADVDPDGGSAIQLTREQWRLLTYVDGQTPIWAMAQTLQTAEPVILRLAGELVAAGVLEVVGRAAPDSGEI